MLNSVGLSEAESVIPSFYQQPTNTNVNTVNQF